MAPSVKLHIASLACFTLIVLAYLLSPLLPAPKTPAADLIGLLINFSSSVGTILAAVVALHLGVDAQKRSIGSENARASIAAARLVGRLERIGHRIDWTIQAALYKGSDDGRYRYLLMGIRGDDLSDEALRFTDDELLGLLPLGKECSTMIALGTTELLRIRRSIEGHEKIFKELSSADEKATLVKQWMDGLQTISAALRRTHGTLSAAVGQIQPTKRDGAA
ncbi:MAG: hypothetical protein L6Q75_06145 [Burkholderiaceae bacterium]|nr:hypothetical protein [Burkholderiaceae bacterium]